jgi:oligoendopeptidase F
MIKNFSMKQEYTYWLALANAENIYTRRKNEILAKIHEDNSSLAHFFTEENNWKNRFDLSQDEIQSLLQEKEKLNNYSFILEDLLEQGYQIIPIG